MRLKEHLWRLFDGSLAMFAALVAVAGVATPAFLLPPAWGFPVSGGLMLVASYSLGAWLREPDYTPSPDWTGGCNAVRMSCCDTPEGPDGPR